MQVIHCHLHLITTPEKLVFSVKVPVITSKISIINCHIKSITIIVITQDSSSKYYYTPGWREAL